MTKRPRSDITYTTLVDEDGTIYSALGGGGGSGAVTIADGADAAEGARADAAVINPASSASVIAALKGVLTLLTTSLSHLVGLGATGYSVGHITTSTTTVVKATPGVIRAIVVNSLGTVASTCTVRNGAVSVIAIIDTLDTTGHVGTYTYNVAMDTNITIITTGTVAPDISVIYN